MRVILQEKIVNLGNVGDQVKVKPGFARNYLIPYGKAVPATPKRIAEFEQRRAELEKTAALALDKARERAEALSAAHITIAVKASEEGKLFGSVSAREIAEAFSRAGIPVEKREVNLPEGPIRQVGKYTVQLQLHSDVKVPVEIEVLAEV